MVKPPKTCSFENPSEPKMTSQKMLHEFLANLQKNTKDQTNHMPCRQQDRDSFEELPLCTKEQLVGFMTGSLFYGLLESPFKWVYLYLKKAYVIHIKAYIIYYIYIYIDNPLHKLH